MILPQIQKYLQAVYRVELKYQVEDFMLTSPAGGLQEALFIRRQGDAIEIGLFIAPKLLRRLKKNDPFVHLNRRNLEDFLLAVEGVSHFVYYLLKAQREMPVTRLEMEIQAEVDKFLLVCFLFLGQRKRVPPFMLDTLFENIRLASERYQEANRFASKFCARLDRDHLRYHRWRQGLERARRFYALDHWAKIAQLTP